MQYEESKILFIAPYRSLAFEIENDLEKVFGPIGISVSQLYGGSLFNRLDEQVVMESDVIIATQEKAKALFRSDSEILKSIKLIVLDEGHLLGANERLIRNEMFMEELRYHMNQSGGRFVVLSAVLPNPEDLAHWLTKSKENVFASDWRPSEERIGILEWTGRNVNLKWRSADDERDSFNNKFVVAEELPLTGRQTVVKYLPGNKNEAVAAAAIKLFSFGTVLIFVGLKSSVLTMAKAYAKVLGHVDDFPWKNQNNWKAFVLACIEYDGPDSNWLRYAKKGILCHNASLPADVRIPLERIMRTEKPRVIIATSTLGQGVNLGVSSVIFSTIYQAGEPIGHGDFWNIAGRAGRAFVDQEGKILVAHDVSDNRTLKKRRQNRWKQRQIESYFEKTNIQSVESGLLWLIKTLNFIAYRFNKLNFDTFIQLVAENQLEDLKESDWVVEGLDLIDDTLLALHQQFNEGDDVYNVTWVESFFKQSLAFIQLEQQNDEDLSDDEMVSFVKARIHGIIASVGTDRSKWNVHVTSGIPLQSDLILEAHLGDIISEIEAYFEETDKLLADKIKLLMSLEAMINQVPVLKMDYLESEHLETIRELWISGSSMTEIKNLPDSIAIVQEHNSFKLPWVLNGIAKKLSVLELEKECELLQEIALLSETGLPNLVAVKIYQAGIRSRTASTELSAFFDQEAWDNGIKFYKHIIRQNALELKEEVSNET
ncbi:MAG: DEAD/DEAH box helicase, partial [Bacteroidota bacterium]